jgi:hypothetical protein
VKSVSLDGTPHVRHTKSRAPRHFFWNYGDSHRVSSGSLRSRSRHMFKALSILIICSGSGSLTLPFIACLCSPMNQSRLHAENYGDSYRINARFDFVDCTPLLRHA